MQKQQCEYINIEKIIVEAGPIVYHSSGISEVLRIIMESSVAMISHRAIGTSLSTCDIKLLYAHIRHNLFNITVKYWIEKLQRTIYRCH